MIARLFALLFGPSIETLLNNARALGSTTLQDEEGAGWVFTIRPPIESKHTGVRRNINTWSGRKPTVRAAIIEALNEAATIPIATFSREPCIPKLGGAEFDE